MTLQRGKAAVSPNATHTFCNFVHVRILVKGGLGRLHGTLTVRVSPVWLHLMSCISHSQVWGRGAGFPIARAFHDVDAKPVSGEPLSSTYSEYRRLQCDTAIHGVSHPGAHNSAPSVESLPDGFSLNVGQRHRFSHCGRCSQQCQADRKGE